MARSILLVAVLAIGAPGLLAFESFEQAWQSSRETRSLNLFEDASPVFSAATPARVDGTAFLRGQDEPYRDPTPEMFGAGASLGINYAAIGIGFGLWFEVYPLPFLAINAHTSIAYGILGSPYLDGGDGLAFSFQVGGKFVIDFEEIEITRWLRPFVAFYPFGVAYFSGTEEFDPPGTGNTDEITYSDAFFLMSGGFGSDFYITPNIGVGVAIYIYGTIGGSRHDKPGDDLDTEGSVGVYVEYVRLALRF
jgi:hypothetical protein